MLNYSGFSAYKTLVVNEPSYQAFFQIDHSRLNKPLQQNIVIPILNNGKFTAIFTTPSMKQGEFGFINNSPSNQKYNEQQAVDLITTFWKSHNIEHFDQFTITRYTSSELNNAAASGYFVLAVIYAIHQNSLTSEDVSKEWVIQLFSNFIHKISDHAQLPQVREILIDHGFTFEPFVDNEASKSNERVKYRVVQPQSETAKSPVLPKTSEPPNLPKPTQTTVDPPKFIVDIPIPTSKPNIGKFVNESFKKKNENEITRLNNETFNIQL